MDVRALADAPLEDAAAVAGRWSATARDLESTGTELREHGKLVGWTGTASEAMRHRIDSSANRLLAVTVTARWVGTVLGHHATVLSQVRSQVAPVLALARRTGMQVSPGGTVTPPVPLPPLSALAAAWSLVLHACRTFATALDEAAAAVIAALCSVREAPPVSAVDRGTPDARGAAAEFIADSAATSAAVTMPSGLTTPLDDSREAALRTAVVAARQELALRGLDPNAVGVTVEQIDGEAVVVVGDIRTADKITTLVSGVGSSADGALVGSAGGAGRIAGAGHAVVAWHGYNAPGNVGHGMNPAYAGAGAPALRRVQSTLRNRSVEGAELQIVAHSYGTTLVGAAARDQSNPLDADTVHLLGSPGTGVQRADQMHVGAPDGGAEIHSWRAPGDLIGATTGASGGVHGVDPTSAGFGADTSNGLTVGQQGGVVGRILGRMTDGYLWFRGEWDSHSSYLSDDHVLEQVR